MMLGKCLGKSVLGKVVSFVIVNVFLLSNLFAGGELSVFTVSLASAAEFKAVTAPTIETDAKKDVLAPYLISADPKAQDEVDRLLETVRQRGLKDRVQAVEASWVEGYINRWIEEAGQFAGKKSLPRDPQILLQAFSVSIRNSAIKSEISDKVTDDIIALAKPVFEKTAKAQYPATKYLEVADELLINKGAIVFDMDDTVAGAKKPITPAILKLLGEYMKRGIKVVIMSGNSQNETKQRIVEPLIEAGYGNLVAKYYYEYQNLGATWCRYTANGGMVNDKGIPIGKPEDRGIIDRATIDKVKTYAQDALQDVLNKMEPSKRKDFVGSWGKWYGGPERKKEFHSTFNSILTDTGIIRELHEYTPEQTENNVDLQCPWIENRNDAQLTIKLLPERTPYKDEYDEEQETQEIRHDIIKFIKAKLGSKADELDFTKGGFGSIDINIHGSDKALALTEFINNHKLTAESIVYFGDKVSKDGNDLSVVAKIPGVRAVAVNDLEKNPLAEEAVNKGAFWPGKTMEGTTIYLSSLYTHLLFKDIMEGSKPDENFKTALSSFGITPDLPSVAAALYGYYNVQGDFVKGELRADIEKLLGIEDIMAENTGKEGCEDVVNMLVGAVKGLSAYMRSNNIFDWASFKISHNAELLEQLMIAVKGGGAIRNSISALLEEKIKDIEFTGALDEKFGIQIAGLPSLVAALHGSYDIDGNFEKGALMRGEIEKLFGIEDIVEGQRAPADLRAEARQRAVNAMVNIVKGLPDGWANLTETNKQSEFNRLFGSRQVILAGGFGARFSNVYHKAMISYGTGESVAQHASNGSYSSGLKTVVVAGPKVIDSLLRSDSVSKATFINEIHDIISKPYSGEMFKIVPDKIIDRAKVALYFPEDAIIVYVADAIGSGHAFLSAALALGDNLKETKFLQPVFGEMAQAALQSKSAASLISVLEAISTEKELVAVGKPSKKPEETYSLSHVEGKGTFYYVTVNGKLIFVYRDWKEMTKDAQEAIKKNIEKLAEWAKMPQGTADEQEAKKKTLNALRKDCPAITEAGEWLISANCAVFSTDILKAEETMKVIIDNYWSIVALPANKEIHRKAKLDETEATRLIKQAKEDEKDTVTKKELLNKAKKLKDDGSAALKGLSDKIKEGPYWTVDPKKPLNLEFVIWRLFEVIQSNNPNVTAGITSAGNAPDSIKEATRLGAFAKPYEGQLKAALKAKGVDVSGLKKLRVSNAAFFKEFLENSNNGLATLALAGIVHLDAKAAIGNNVKITNSYIGSGAIIGDGAKINNAWVEGNISKNAVIEEKVEAEDPTTIEAKKYVEKLKVNQQDVIGDLAEVSKSNSDKYFHIILRMLEISPYLGSQDRVLVLLQKIESIEIAVQNINKTAVLIALDKQILTPDSLSDPYLNPIKIEKDPIVVANIKAIEAVKGTKNGSTFDIGAAIQEEKSELENTLGSVMPNANLKDGVVILAIDDGLYKGLANPVVTQLSALMGRNTMPGAFVVVRGAAEDLQQNINKAEADMKAKGLKVRKVVTQLSANAPAGTKSSLSSIGVVLSVDLQGRGIDGHYLQIIRLLNLSLKIAYDFEPEEISSTLEKIIGKSVSLKDLSSMLAKKILEIVPKMERIDMQTASEAYRAVRQALVSL